MYGEPKLDPLRICIELKRPFTTLSEAFHGLEAFLGAEHDISKLQHYPVFESLNPELLKKLVDRARQRSAHYKPADFSTWLQVITPPGIQPEEMVKALRGLRAVQTAYVLRPPESLPGPDQGYLDIAPRGIGAKPTVGDGSGIGFVDMEQGWNLNHQDLPLGIQIISGVNTKWKDSIPHGTSVLGQVLMVANRLGGVGIAPAAKPRVISQWRVSGYDTADAIRDAAAHMEFGDVLLLEAHEEDPKGTKDLLPVEVLPLSYKAILEATASGIVVIEAAGNGPAVDLDAYVDVAGQRIFDTNIREDSGAIMVGAARSTSPHWPMWYSNRGQRIDCYAWGEDVFTTGTDDAGTDNTKFISNFGGTSSASAIVAGAALIVQGLREASGRARFGPSKLRELLKNNSTPSGNGQPTDRIGFMPDLAKIRAKISSIA